MHEKPLYPPSPEPEEIEITIKDIVNIIDEVGWQDPRAKEIIDRWYELKNDQIDDTNPHPGVRRLNIELAEIYEQIGEHDKALDMLWDVINNMFDDKRESVEMDIYNEVMAKIDHLDELIKDEDMELGHE